jgi:hypothetical protein
MLSRRVLVVASLAVVPVSSLAQQGPAFVGQWQGQVDGIGNARLIITAVRPNGQVEGRMEFDLQSFVSTFGDKADSVKNTNRGIVSGPTLTIDSALGGTYRLTLAGDRLAGTYVRGTTFSGSAAFKKI